jgi:hypothetical protein
MTIAETDPRAGQDDDQDTSQDTRQEREELFGFHPDILGQAAPAPRKLPRAGTASPA